jgi:hypothetical protein
MALCSRIDLLSNIRNGFGKTILKLHGAVHGVWSIGHGVRRDAINGDPGGIIA